MIIITIIILLVYIASPLVGKIALFFLNMIIPDPIPFVDEAIMVIALAMHIDRLERLKEFALEHKALSIVIALVAVVLLVWLVPIIWRWLI